MTTNPPKTTFAGSNPWAGLQVKQATKKSKEQRLEGWKKPPNGEPKQPRQIANQPKGDKVGTSKLTNEDVTKIKEMLEKEKRIREHLAEYSPQAIAAKFGISWSTIYAIRKGLAWGSVTGIDCKSNSKRKGKKS
jgi:beta-glucanase (GH16 family)